MRDCLVKGAGRGLFPVFRGLGFWILEIGTSGVRTLTVLLSACAHKPQAC